ncbi:MAG: GerMN domain-containing protein [Clostridia bacterium]|nr:GerMN domain-containing protein [Clostridia bacterium]
MKRLFLAILLLAAAVLLTACSRRPPEALISDSAPDSQAVSAAPEDGAEAQFTATLYFRYADSALLRQETRGITVAPNETREKALVSALLDGSREAGSRALFPEKTEVLSTQAQDGIIYVTFSDALYGRYADEAKDPQEGMLRRRLAMAALAATLTESGEYQAVQVLVRSEGNVGTSMRLKNSFFDEKEEGTAAPLTRMQAYLPTPGNIAAAVMRAWLQRDWNSMDALITSRGNLSAAQLSERLGAAPVLIDYGTSEATVSLDGTKAVACVDMTLRRTDGSEYEKLSVPLPLLRESGIWRVDVQRLLALMEANDE